MLCESVDQSNDTGRAGKDAAPLFEAQVGGDPPRILHLQSRSLMIRPRGDLSRRRMLSTESAQAIPLIRIGTDGPEATHAPGLQPPPLHPAVEGDERDLDLVGE